MKILFKYHIKPRTVFISEGKEWMRLKITERSCIFLKENIYTLIDFSYRGHIFIVFSSHGGDEKQFI